MAQVKEHKLNTLKKGKKRLHDENRMVSLMTICKAKNSEYSAK